MIDCSRFQYLNLATFEFWKILKSMYFAYCVDNLKVKTDDKGADTYPDKAIDYFWISVVLTETSVIFL